MSIKKLIKHSKVFLLKVSLRDLKDIKKDLDKRFLTISSKNPSKSELLFIEKETKKLNKKIQHIQNLIDKHKN